MNAAAVAIGPAEIRSIGGLHRREHLRYRSPRTDEGHHGRGKGRSCGPALQNSENTGLPIWYSSLCARVLPCAITTFFPVHQADCAQARSRLLELALSADVTRDLAEDGRSRRERRPSPDEAFLGLDDLGHLPAVRSGVTAAGSGQAGQGWRRQRRGFSEIVQPNATRRAGRQMVND